MRLDVFAGQPHYVDHIAPIWHRLPVERRGTFYGTRQAAAHAAIAHSVVGQSLTVERVGAPDPQGVTLVAGQEDLEWIAQGGHRGPVVFLEHGAGQHYGGDLHMSSRAGGPGAPGREAVALYLCPNEHVAVENRRAYHKAQAVTVGAPKLDSLHSTQRYAGWQVHEPGPPWRVAFTWHWRNAKLGHEALPALEHYRHALPAVMEQLRGLGIEPLGHMHPRADRDAVKLYEKLGVTYVRNPDLVLTMAHVLVADNTSLAYEFASLDKPVLSLNAPWYRREVEHGLRFWSHVPGLMCDDPSELVDSILATIEDPPGARDRRRAAVFRAYAYRDGLASQRAVDAIMGVL